MENWRKDQGISIHQVGHWSSSSSSYAGKPPLDKRYMNMHSNVMNWENYAIKEAFDDAKFRNWAENNGFPCNIPLPDPNMHIDDIDWNSEAYQDLDREVEARSNMKEKGHEALIIDNSLSLKQSFFGLGWGLGPTGWEDGEKEEIKAPEPSYVAEGWRSSNHENNETNFWEENDSERWISKEQYGGDLHDKYQTSNGWNRNWGALEGNDRRTEISMSWSKNPTYQHANNEMNSGRGNRGRGRGGGGRGGRGRGEGGGGRRGRGRGRRGRRGNYTSSS